MTAPLRELLVKNKPWQWGKSHIQSFERKKKLLVSKKCLAYYDAQTPVKIQVDASKSGVGAVLLQNDRPTAYLSKSLTAMQQRYAPIEQEMLAVVFGCQRFHQYIYGKKATIQSDHKPLETIMKKPLQNTPPRLQRMLLSLQKYDVNLVYLAGKENILADTLSHVHMEETTDDIPEEELRPQVHMVYENAPATKSRSEEIKEETAKDAGLKKVTKPIIEGWPNSKDNILNEAKSYWSFRELSIINGIVFKSERLVIPEVTRKKVLEQLHQAHMGIQKTK